MGRFATGPSVSCDFLSRCMVCRLLSDDACHTSGACDFVSDGRTLVRVKRRIRYVSDDGSWQITRAGLISDGSSNPPVTWRSLGHPFKPTRFKSSLWHDQEYQNAPASDASIWRAIWSERRKYVDDKYLEMMTTEGDEDRIKVHRGVRLGAWWAWYLHARENKRKQQREVANG